jgi:tetratricopeptide (TPR) repeat protein
MTRQVHHQASRPGSRLQQAMALHRQGQLQRAQALYEEILASDAQNFQALHLAGVVAVQTGRPLEALQLLDRALALEPLSAQAHFNKGSALRECGRLEAALSSYEQALALKDDYPEAHNGKAAVLRLLGDLDGALASCEQAIRLRADYPEAHINLGNVLRDRGEPARALESYDRAVAIRPAAVAYLNRGNAQRALGQLEAALVSYDRAIALQPENAEAYCNRGAVLREQGQAAAALASCDRAIALRPSLAEAYSNRGNTLCDLGQPEVALANYDQAIALQPQCADAHVNRGNLLQQQGQLAAALASYDRAIDLRPGLAEAWSNRGNVLRQQGELSAALASYDRAIALRPHYPEAYASRGIVRLLRGDFAAGWADYEWRWKTRTHLLNERLPCASPPWLGREPLRGRTILLHSEQGLGDTLQFCRYAGAVAELGAHVILQVQPALLSLLETLEGPQRVIPRGTQPQFDFHCPLLSLPLAFQTRLDTIPSRASYLCADADKVRRWRARLGQGAPARIGLAWSGGARLAEDGARSVALARLLPHLPAEFHYVSLQKEVRPRDREAMQTASRLLNFTDASRQLEDFTDTAALCRCLDLVISVDTSVAHLSAALGIPTWILLPLVPDWRWLLNRDDSPWYPSVRLYRQVSAADWQQVFERVGTDLLHSFSAARTTPDSPSATCA